MTSPYGTEELASLLKRLAERDREFRVFGSSYHRYRVGPVLPESELSSFEAQHEIRLPEDFRSFVTHIANGGAGPFYGLDPLRTVGPNVALPFPLREAGELSDEDDEGRYGDGGGPGIFSFCHQGCGYFSHLVLKGPEYGTVWDGDASFHPTGLTFSEWYGSWATQAIQLLENESLVDRIQTGMSKQKVFELTGDDWRSYTSKDGTKHCLFGTRTPADLDVDEEGTVTSIKPWSSIQVRPTK